jgi:hypothetical protein
MLLLLKIFIIILERAMRLVCFSFFHLTYLVMEGSRISPIGLSPTESNRTFANGESPQDVLARVHWTFANWRKSDGALAKVQWTVANWRKSSDVLAKVLWTLANWRKYSNLLLVGK